MEQLTSQRDFFLPATATLLPLSVRQLFFVRWPLQGKPISCLIPRQHLISFNLWIASLLNLLCESKPQEIIAISIKLSYKVNFKEECKRGGITRSPSIIYLETSSRREISSSSERSLVILLSSERSQRIWRERERPMPWMYCRENSTLLLLGISTPPTRTHLMLSIPWRCKASKQTTSENLHQIESRERGFKNRGPQNWRCGWRRRDWWRKERNGLGLG